jgi:thiamine-phosphate pyrophosphorylase
LVNKIKYLGADIIQLRDKKSKKEDILKESFVLQRILSKAGCLFIVNDYLDIAKIADCDGLHIGQQDTSIGIARKLLGRDKIIGISCHSLTQALKAQENGADYIGLGPIFSTPTKPEYKPIGLDSIKECIKKIKIPVFVIGGINKDNLNEVLAYGAKRVVICRGVCQAGNITKRMGVLRRLLN